MKTKSQLTSAAIVGIFCLTSSLTYSQETGANQVPKPNQDQVNRVPIDKLPASPDDPQSKILDRTRVGNKETITFEYAGRKFQEERVYGLGQKDRLAATDKRHFDYLTNSVKLSEDKALQAVFILSKHLIATQGLLHGKGNVPDRAKQMMLRYHAAQCKTELAKALGSDDPKLLEKVVKADGDDVPVVPMKDFVVRHFKDEPPVFDGN